MDIYYPAKTVAIFQTSSLITQRSANIARLFAATGWHTTLVCGSKLSDSSKIETVHCGSFLIRRVPYSPPPGAVPPRWTEEPRSDLDSMEGDVRKVGLYDLCEQDLVEKVFSKVPLVYEVHSSFDPWSFFFEGARQSFDLYVALDPLQLYICGALTAHFGKKLMYDLQRELASYNDILNKVEFTSAYLVDILTCSDRSIGCELYKNSLCPFPVVLNTQDLEYIHECLSKGDCDSSLSEGVRRFRAFVTAPDFNERQVNPLEQLIAMMWKSKQIGDKEKVKSFTETLGVLIKEL